MQRIDLIFERPEPEVAAEAGLLHGEDKIRTLVTESAEVYNPRGGIEAIYFKQAIPTVMADAAYFALRTSARMASSNRGMATGRKEPGSSVQQYRIRKDGTRGRTREAMADIKSGIVGYFDRYPRIPYCRLTAWTMEHQEEFLEALPAIKLCNRLFEANLPQRYSAQKNFVDSTHKEWVIPGTVFTTITVNSNWQTAQHQDSGDCRLGFGCMAVLGHDFEGCYFMFPKYAVGFAMQPGDFILANVHEWHCNSPIKLLKEDAERLSLVMYYRENMEKCGTVAEELEIAKNRVEGDPTWEAEAPLFK